jgi:hypothetical protein
VNRWGFALKWGLTVGLLPLVAQAREDAKAHLAWRTPIDPRCVNAIEIEQQVQQRLGRQVFVAAAEADIVLDVTTTARAEQLHLISVELRSSRGAHWGKREIEVQGDCAAVQSSLVLMLSLTADIAKEEVERLIQRDRLNTTSVSPVLSISGVQGLLPGFAFGPALTFGIYSPLVGWWELGAAYYPAKSLGSPEQAEISAGTLSLRGCPLALHEMRASVWACAALRGGYVAGKGVGFDASFAREEPFWSAGAAIRGSWEISKPWFLAGDVGGDVTLRRTDFYYQAGATSRDLFSTAPALFFVNLGLGLRL